MSPPPLLGETYCFCPVCHKFTHSYILIESSLKLCILAYYYMENRILLRNFDQTIFLRVNTLYNWRETCFSIKNNLLIFSIFRGALYQISSKSIDPSYIFFYIFTGVLYEISSISINASYLLFSIFRGTLCQINSMGIVGYMFCFVDHTWNVFVL